MGKHVTIIVMGDEGCGKTSIIRAFITKHFSFDVERVAPDSIVPSMQEFTSQSESVTVLDSSADQENRRFLASRLSIADTAMILYDATRPESLETIENVWLPMVKDAFGDSKCRSALLVITKGNMLSMEDSIALRSSMTDTLNSFRSKFPFLYSTYYLPANSEPEEFEKIFALAESIAIFPRAPLYDIAAKTPCFTALALQALHRIFRIYDRDQDCLLSDEEFAYLHLTCLEIEITAKEIVAVKRRVYDTVRGEASSSTPQSKSPSKIGDGKPTAKGAPNASGDLFAFPPSPRGVTKKSGKMAAAKGPSDEFEYFTFRGFLAMFEMLFANDRVNRMLWTVLRYHGYEPECMECPFEDDEDCDEVDLSPQHESKQDESGCARCNTPGSQDTPCSVNDDASGSSTLSHDAQEFLEYVYDTCMCPHFQIPGAVHGAPRLQDVFAVMMQHTEEVQRRSCSRHHDPSYRFQVLGAGVGAGRSVCGPEEVQRARWMACWEGLALCHPRIAKKLLFSLGLEFDPALCTDREDGYLYRYSKREWRESIRDRNVINVTLFSGCEDVSSLPPTSLVLLSSLTCSEEGESIAITTLVESSDQRKLLLENTVTSTFTCDRVQKKGRRHFVMTYVPQSLASDWMRRRMHECDLVLLVFSATGRDGHGGHKSLKFLVDLAERIESLGVGTSRMFVCVDAVMQTAPIFDDNNSVVVDAQDDSGDVSSEDEPSPFQTAVDYVKTTSLPQVEKVNSLQLGRAMDSAALRAFGASLEDALPKRSADRGMLSFTSWIMSWASALWRWISYFLPTRFRLFGLGIV